MADAAIIEKIFKFYATEAPTNIQARPGVLKWYQDENNTIRTFEKDHRNLRNSLSNEVRLRKSFRTKGLCDGRKPPICRFSPNQQLPLRLLTWGNLLRSCYEEFELPERHPVMDALPREGLQVSVVSLTWRLPDVLADWVVSRDNTFHDGMCDGASKYMQAVFNLCGKLRAFRNLNDYDAKTPERQVIMRKAMAGVFS